MIKNIRINNFRGFTSLEVSDFKRINIFAGKNNCGKTSILEAIFMATGISNPVLAATVNNLRQLATRKPEDLGFIFNKLNFSNKVKIEAELSNSQRRTLKISPHFESSDFIEPQNINEDGKITTLRASAAISASPEAVMNGLNFDFSISESKNKTKKYQSSILMTKNELNQYTLNTVKAENYKETLGGSFTPPNDVSSYSKELDELIIAKRKGEIIEILKAIEPSISDVSMDRNQVIWVDMGYKSLIPLNLTGDGMRKILYLATLLNSRAGQIISIDEIENGLHYSSLKVLWKVLLKAAFDNGIQLFLTTHNHEVLKYLRCVLESDEFRDYSDDIRCFTIRKHAENNIKSYKYDFDKLQYSLNQEIEIR